MSIFASASRVTVPLVADPPNTITVRKLTGREVERAQAEHQRQFVGGHSPRAWAGALRRLLINGSTVAIPDALVADALGDPLLGFDRYVVVKAGLVGWTYTDGTPTDAAIDDLDDDAVDTIAREILRLSKPALFQTAAERDAAKKNA